MKFTFNHFNFNVVDLERSLEFYEKALGLKEIRRKERDAFKIVYLGDGSDDFYLELTWLADHPKPYDLGECEFHLAFRVEDYEAAHKLHEEMGCICYENLE
ncbi:MAG: VOC family protein, partial [Synergistes sp.]|nr:VOC family protein [Synergistes sp.]